MMKYDGLVLARTRSEKDGQVKANSDKSMMAKPKLQLSEKRYESVNIKMDQTCHKLIDDH